MPLGLSSGELALIALAGAVAFGPKDVPVIARTAGRLAGRAVGHLRSFRTTMGSFAERAQIAQVHLELQQAMAQLEAIRHELRSGVSLSSSVPLTRSAAIKEERITEDLEQNGLKEKHLGLRHPPHTSIKTAQEAFGGAFSPSYREPFSSTRGNVLTVDSTNNEYGTKSTELSNASLGLRSPLLSEEISKWSTNMQSTDSVLASLRVSEHGASDRCSESNGFVVKESGKDGEPVQFGDSKKGELQNSVHGVGGDNTEDDCFQRNVVPISAVTAGLIPKRAGGSTSGSDILMDSLVEEEVASHAVLFLKDHPPHNS